MGRSKGDSKAAAQPGSKRKASHVEEKVPARRSKRAKNTEESGAGNEIEGLTQTIGPIPGQPKPSTSSRNTRGRSGKQRTGDRGSPLALLAAIAEQAESRSTPHEPAPQDEAEGDAQDVKDLLTQQQEPAESVETRAKHSALATVDAPKRQPASQSTLENEGASTEADQQDVMNMDLTGAVNKVRSATNNAVNLVCDTKAAVIVPDPSLVIEHLYAAVLGREWHDNSARLLYNSDLDAADFMRALIWARLKKNVFDAELLPDILHCQLLERKSMIRKYLAPLVEEYDCVGLQASVNQINDKSWRNEHILPVAKICAYKTGLSLVDHILHCSSAGLSAQKQRRWRQEIQIVCYEALLLKLKMEVSDEACELRGYQWGDQVFSDDDGTDDSKMVAFTIEPGILKDGTTMAFADNWLVLPKVKLVNRQEA